MTLIIYILLPIIFLSKFFISLLKIRRNFNIKRSLNHLYQQIRRKIPIRSKIIEYLMRSSATPYLASKVMNSRIKNQTNFVLLCIGSLANGGAERQWANIAIGLKNRGYSPILVTENNLSGSSNWIVKDLDFYDIPVIAISEKKLKFREFLKYKYKFLYLDKTFDSIYNDICQNIDFDETFISVCEIVKEYQPKAIISALDPVNINFGLSGLLQNVPKISMSFRSVAPNNYNEIFSISNFKYRIYRYLYFNPSITVNANSEHGGESYRKYFDDTEKEIDIKIIQNSTILSDDILGNLKELRNTECCSKFHIFGAMRLSPEKSPLSWLDVIDFINYRNPQDFHFILYGEGIQKNEVLSRLSYLKSRGLDVDYRGYTDFILPIFFEKGLVISTSLFEGHSNLEEEAKMFQYSYIKVFDQNNIIILNHNKDDYSARLLTLDKLNDVCDKVLFLSTKESRSIDLTQYSISSSASLRLQIDAVVDTLKL